jgi:hypothetical protein
MVVTYEPITLVEAMSKEDGERWKEAINKEINSLKNNNTWELVPLLEGRKHVGSKWVFWIKGKANGEINKFKAKLVVKGFTQIHGVDFGEMFALVTKFVFIHILLSFGVALDLEIQKNGCQINLLDWKVK